MKGAIRVSLRMPGGLRGHIRRLQSGVDTRLQQRLAALSQLVS